MMLDKSVLLQVINGYLTVFATCALYIFARYLKRHFHLGYKELRAAIAILALCSGTIILRGPVFYVRTLINAGEKAPNLDWAYSIGGIIIGIAFLCVIRVFSPEEWGHKSWITSFLFGTIVVGISLLYVHGV